MVNQANTLKSEPKCQTTNKQLFSFVFQRTERFQHSVVISGKKRQWKALKQILAQEVCETTTKESTTSTTSMLRPMPSSIRGPLYGSIDAPPSFRPAKKYSDISGLETHYTDPHTKLNFANTAEYKIIKKLPSDLVAGYLTLRRANTQLQ